jgi:hypothetical protein
VRHRRRRSGAGPGRSGPVGRGDPQVGDHQGCRRGQRHQPGPRAQRRPARRHVVDLAAVHQRAVLAHPPDPTRPPNPVGASARDRARQPRPALSSLPPTQVPSGLGPGRGQGPTTPRPARRPPPPPEPRPPTTWRPHPVRQRRRRAAGAGAHRLHRRLRTLAAESIDRRRGGASALPPPDDHCHERGRHREREHEPGYRQCYPAAIHGRDPPSSEAVGKPRGIVAG